jgi:ferrous iron transport protein A
MSIHDLTIGQKATIITIHALPELKHRLKALGIHRGANIEVRAFAPGKQNVELNIDGTLVGLRIREMKMIEVKPLP